MITIYGRPRMEAGKGIYKLIALWSEKLKGYSPVDIKKAFDKYVNDGNDYFPKIPSILKILKSSTLTTNSIMALQDKKANPTDTRDAETKEIDESIAIFFQGLTSARKEIANEIILNMYLETDSHKNSLRGKELNTGGLNALRGLSQYSLRILFKEGRKVEFWDSYSIKCKGLD